jgi:hypothetical protein
MLSMPKRLSTLLMLFALMWQTVGMLTPFSVAAQADDLAHKLVHAQEVGHHHHVDNSLHTAADESFETHQHADDGLTPVALPPATGTQFTEHQPASPTAAAPSLYVPPALAGLLRPPMLHV